MAFAVISQAQCPQQWQVRFYRVEGSRVRLASAVQCRWAMVLSLVGPIEPPQPQPLQAP